MPAHIHLYGRGRILNLSEEPKKDYSEEAERVKKFLFSEETWIDIGTIFVKVAFIIILAMIVVKVGKAIVRRFFKLQRKSPLRHSERRENTLQKLLENTLTYIVYFAAIVAVLEAFEIKVAGLLAGAGVLGLAVGFGAQSLVKDVITGFFIIFEDQFSVGDYVKIGSVEGDVEEIGLRTTKIKSFTGEVSIIPNGTIGQVTNYSIENSLAIVDVSIPYDVDIHSIEAKIESFLLLFAEKNDEILNKPKLIGVQKFTETEAFLRITAETQPMQHYKVATEISIGLKTHLKNEGIDIPYPILVSQSLLSV